MKLNLSWRQLNGFKAIHLPLLSQVGDAVALAVQKSQLLEEVRAGQERLQALSHRLLEVQEAERQHLARELHDEVGQVLTALKLTLETIDAQRPAVAGSRLSEAQQLLDTLITRVRELSLDLRPAMLDDLGLLPALVWLFGRCASLTNVAVRFEQQGLQRRFAPETEIGAYRIVQEALTNVARHAVVNAATVRLWIDAGMLHLRILDDGRGFEPAAVLSAGTTGGLPGVRERVRLLGGHLDVESTPGKGTCISAQLPV